MTSIQNENYVYQKDKESNTYKIVEIVFDNQTIQHCASFTNVYTPVKNLPQFPSRKDDVWVIGYPKSG